jgi:hypothetical protein
MVASCKVTSCKVASCKVTNCRGIPGAYSNDAATAPIPYFQHKTAPVPVRTLKERKNSVKTPEVFQNTFWAMIVVGSNSLYDGRGAVKDGRGATFVLAVPVAAPVPCLRLVRINLVQAIAG